MQIIKHKPPQVVWKQFISVSLWLVILILNESEYYSTRLSTAASCSYTELWFALSISVSRCKCASHSRHVCCREHRTVYLGFFFHLGLGLFLIIIKTGSYFNLPDKCQMCENNLYLPERLLLLSHTLNSVHFAQTEILNHKRKEIFLKNVPADKLYFSLS